jgi:hypothetical protein
MDSPGVDDTAEPTGVQSGIMAGWDGCCVQALAWFDCNLSRNGLRAIITDISS